MKGTGILIDNNYDLLLKENEDGKYVTGIGDVVPQNQALIVTSNPGEWKQFPELGVGIESWLLDDAPGNLQAEVKRQLKSDGFKVNKITLDSGRLAIDAEYP